MPYIGTHSDETELQEMGFSKNNFWETRTRIELHGQWYPIQKLKILFSAPYIINTEGRNANENTNTSTLRLAHAGHEHDDAEEATTPGRETTKGIGDPLVIAHYQLFNKTGDSSAFSQRILAGGGIKFPVGKWKLEEVAEAHERVHQPGTGSWDYILSAEYLAKYKRAGLNVNASYFIATRNNQSFKCSNRINANAVFYYQVKIKDASLYPSMGAYIEQAGKDNDNNLLLQNSGGTILYAHAGIDFYFRNFCINTAFQLPSMQKLNEPQPQMKYRIIAGITYAFD